MPARPKPTSIQGMLDDIELFGRGKTRLEKRLAVTDERLRHALSLLETAVKDGKSTGDHIRDYLLMTGFGLDEEAKERLHTLERSLKGKQGELVLVSFHAKVKYKTLRTDLPDRTEIVPLFRMGLLASEALLLVPFSSHVTVHPGNNRFLALDVRWFIRSTLKEGLRSASGAVEGNMCDPFAYHHFREHGTPPHLVSLVKSLEDPIVVGDTEVKRWLQSRHLFDEEDFEVVRHRLVSAPVKTKEVA